MKIGFALITEEPFFGSIIELENRLHDRAGFMDTLGSEHKLPHTTIFQGNMQEDTPFEELARGLAGEYLRLFPGREIGFGKAVYVPEGWYFLECVNDPRLHRLHRWLLSRVERYLVLSRNRSLRNVSFMSLKEAAAVRRYDYRYSGAAFYPHITLGRRAEGRSGEVLKLLNEELIRMDRSTRVGRITVYRMGQNGTHIDTLFEVRLTEGERE